MPAIKNALIVDGHTYIAKRALFNPACGNDPCDQCDLKRRCDTNQNCLCAPFEKKGFVPYYKLMRK